MVIDIHDCGDSSLYYGKNGGGDSVLVAPRASSNLRLTNRRYPSPLVIHIRDIRRLSLVAVITRINDARARAYTASLTKYVDARVA